MKLRLEMEVCVQIGGSGGSAARLTPLTAIEPIPVTDWSGAGMDSRPAGRRSNRRLSVDRPIRVGLACSDRYRYRP
jgi:hypothetical protein